MLWMYSKRRTKRKGLELRLIFYPKTIFTEFGMRIMYDKSGKVACGDIVAILVSYVYTYILQSR